MQIAPPNPGVPVASRLIECPRSYWLSRWTAVTWFWWFCELVAMTVRQGWAAIASVMWP